MKNMYSIKKIAVVSRSLLLLVIALAISLHASAGSQPSSDQVNLLHGTYNPSISLGLLPGKAGMKPSLDLVYSSARTNGPIGAGWGLSFWSSIERKTQLGGPVDLTGQSDDPGNHSTFYLEGKQLVELSDGTFRMEHDPFTVITPTRRSFLFLMNRIVSWQVTRNGITRVFGSTNESGLCVHGLEFASEACTEPVRWHLTKVTDSFNNNYTIEYENLVWNGEDTNKLAPARILYNDDNHVVEFSYQDRPDVRLNSRDGLMRTIAKRLETITVSANRDGRPFVSHQYQFDYVQSAGDGQSLLARVSQDLVDPSSGSVSGNETIREFRYSNTVDLSDAWDDWSEIAVIGQSLYPDNYDFSRNESDKIYSSTSQIIDVDRDALPDLIVFNTKCSYSEAISPGFPNEEPDPDVIVISVWTCSAHHRVFINELTDQREPQFHYDAERSTQLINFLGSLMTDYDRDQKHFMLTDLNGDGYVDITVGSSDNANQFMVLRGAQDGWVANSSRLDSAPWTASLDSRNPFTDMQLVDINADGLRDLVSSDKFYLNSGVAPYFEAASGKSLVIKDRRENTFVLPANRPFSAMIPKPGNTGPILNRVIPEGCMTNDAAGRYVYSELGRHNNGITTSHKGLNDPSKRVTASQWVWRHTTFGDYNGDGIADRLVALSWLEEGSVGSGFAISPVWRDSNERCGGVNRLYIGNGKGEFVEAHYSVGGDFGWPGGPRASSESITTVEDIARTFIYTNPVNHLAQIDVDGNGRAEIIQRCQGDLKAVFHKGEIANQGYNLQVDSTVCPDDAVSLPFMRTGSSIEKPVVGHADDGVFAGYLDLNGDGLPDAYVAHNPVHPNDISKLGDALPYWKRNRRPLAHNLLTRITNPQGGATQITWGRSAYSNDELPTSLPVVSAIHSKDGSSTYEFSEGYFNDEGDFIGFGKASATGTSGTRNEWHYSHDPKMPGRLQTEIKFRENGGIHSLTTHVFSPLAGSINYPIFTPVTRTCTFTFKELAIVTQPHPYTTQCELFQGEPAVGSTAFQIIANSEYELLVTETSFNRNIGLVTEVRSFGNVLVAEDFKRETFRYHPYNAALVANLLRVRKVENNAGEARHHYQYPLNQYSGMNWGREVQIGGPNNRSRTRTYQDGLLVSKTNWNNQSEVVYQRDHCNLINYEANGSSWKKVQRDELCRDVVETNSAGLTIEAEFDDLHRVISQKHHASGDQISSTEHYFNTYAELKQPSTVIVVPNKDGTSALQKSYSDENGREWMKIKCQAAREIDREDVEEAKDWEDVFRCLPDDPNDNYYAMKKITLVDVNTRMVGLESTWFDARDGEVELSEKPRYDRYYPKLAIASGIPYTRYETDALGRRSKQINADGQNVTFEYGLNVKKVIAGGVTSRTKKDGMTTISKENGINIGEETVDAFGLINQRKNADGAITKYTHNAFGLVESVISPEVDIYRFCGDSPTTDSPTITKKYTVNDLVQSREDALGRKIRYSYDRDGRPTSVRGPGNILLEAYRYIDTPASERRIITTNSLGESSVEWLDALNRVRKEVDAKGNVIERTFDEQGRLLTTINPTGEVINTTYDIYNRITKRESVRGAISSSEHFSYDARGNVLLHRDADGRVQKVTYDILGRAVKGVLGEQTTKILFENSYRPEGGLDTSLDTGVLTKYEYDNRQRLSSKLIGYDKKSSKSYLTSENYQYAANGKISSTYNTLKEAQEVTYDAMGRQIELSLHSASQFLAKSTRELDAIGNAVGQYDENGHLTCVKYDDYDRVVSITPSGSGQTNIEYERNPRHPLLNRASHSLLTRTISPAGDVTERYTDSLGREWLQKSADGSYMQNVYEGVNLIRQVQRNSSGDTVAVKPIEYYASSSYKFRDWEWLSADEWEDCLDDPDSCNKGYTEFSYTDAGRVSSISDTQGNVSQANYTSDGTMLLKEVSVGGVTSFRHEYDVLYPIKVATEVGATKDPIRQVWEFDRNVFPKTITRSRASTKEQESLLMEYDLAGRRTQASLYLKGDEESAVSWKYDDYGRMQSKSYRIARQNIFQPGKNISIEWEYENNGQISAITYPSGNKVAYTYSADGILDAIELRTGTSIKEIANFKDIDVSGRFGSIAFSNDVRSSFDYEHGRQSRRTVDIKNKTLFSEQYSYDDLGRLAHIDRDWQSRFSDTVNYAYDSRNMLTQEVYELGNEQQSIEYTYNRAGDRLSKDVNGIGNNTLVEYSYQKGHQLNSVGNITLGASAWDEYGRQLSDHRGNDFIYGLGNQLREIRRPDGVSESMLYDVDGQRVARSVSDGSAEAYYLSGSQSGQVLHQRNADGSYHDVVRTPNGGLIATIDKKANISFLTAGMSDALQQFDIKEDAETAARQTAFGEALGDASDNSEIGFHQTWDTSIDAIRIAGVRAYDTETGRFLAPDSLSLASAFDVNNAIDLYRYGHNNPVSVQDSTGYIGVPPPVQTTTIFVDGIRLEVINPASWQGPGMMRVANYNAYIAGVRAGIVKQLKAEVDFFNETGTLPANTILNQIKVTKYDKATSMYVDHTPNTSGGGHSYSFANAQSTVGAAGHSAAASSAVSDANVGGSGGAGSAGSGNNNTAQTVRSANFFVNTDGEIEHPVGPGSREYAHTWFIKTPEGKETHLQGDSEDLLDKFLAQNPGWEAIPEDIEVITAYHDNSSRFWRFLRGVGSRPGQMYDSAVEEFGWMSNDFLGYTGPNSATYRSESSLFSSYENYRRSRGNNPIEATANVAADMFVMSVAAPFVSVGSTFESFGKGDYEAAGEHTFDVGFTAAMMVAGPKIGAVGKGLAVNVANRAAVNWAVRGINPFIRQGRFAKGCLTNCTYVVQIADRIMGGGRSGISPLSGPRRMADIVADMGGGTFNKVAGRAEIVQQLAQAGPGARGIVRTGPVPGSGGVGHVFNVVNVGGSVVFVDAQLGGFASFFTGPTLNRYYLLGFSKNTHLMMTHP